MDDEETLLRSGLLATTYLRQHGFGDEQLGGMSSSDLVHMARMYKDRFEKRMARIRDAHHGDGTRWEDL